eukprot:TRINITY_DN1890_c0_g1_i14.p2 TRINITY_DN1890_c0_g1~~TRINITY_DN1890_c0_g1_i14.p2  ORF type:complete len:104 (-),score=8.36 TRINITY_DN1890_c0_g1_i14:363-674(-)
MHICGFSLFFLSFFLPILLSSSIFPVPCSRIISPAIFILDSRSQVAVVSLVFDLCRDSTGVMGESTNKHGKVRKRDKSGGLGVRGANKNRNCDEMRRGVVCAF